MLHNGGVVRLLLHMGKLSGGSNMIGEATSMLLSGHEGGEVVEFLRSQLKASADRGGRRYSWNTLKTYVSNTKSKVLEAGYRNIKCDMSPLKAFSLREPEINAFLSATLKTQVETQRRHRKNPTWSEPAEDALQCLQLLPTNMLSFKITEREVRTIKRIAKMNLRERMANVIVVEDGATLPVWGGVIRYSLPPPGRVQ